MSMNYVENRLGLIRGQAAFAEALSRFGDGH